MTTSLLLTLVGLALVDSVNVSTIWIVIVILLGARRPAPTGWAYLAGAFITFLVFTILLYYGASFADSAVDGLTMWFRRILFSVLTLALVVLGIRRLKTRQRKGFGLPKWINVWTAFPLGLMATIGDIPNAFPMFLAVERLIDAGVKPETAIPVLIGYSVIYALPTLIVLTLGLLFKDQLRGKLQQLYDRYATGESKASWKIASLYFLAAFVSLAVLVFIVL